MNKSEAELNALAYLEGLGYTCIPSDAKFTPANVKTLAKYLLVWVEQAEKAAEVPTELDSFPKVKGWVARCKWACPEELYFYKGEKPVRCGSQVEDAGGDFYWDFNEEIVPLPPTMFPDLKWEDEPIEVEMIIRKK